MDGGGNHPNTFPRGTRTTTLRKDPAVRVIVYAPAEQRASWIDNELARLDAIVQTARSVAQIIDALVEDPPPRPQVLVVDLDAISAGDLLYLHLVRERGWCGRIIGLGTAPPSLRSSLGIERMLNTPFVRDSLADAIIASLAIRLLVMTGIYLVGGGLLARYAFHRLGHSLRAPLQQPAKQVRLTAVAVKEALSSDRGDTHHA